MASKNHIKTYAKIAAPLIALPLLAGCAGLQPSFPKESENLRYARHASQLEIVVSEKYSPELSDLASLESMIEPKNKYIALFNKKLKECMPYVDSLDNITKTKATYNALRKIFHYKPNLLDSLDPDIYRNTESEDVRRKLSESEIFPVGISKSYESRQASSQSLALLAVSHLRSLGVESYLMAVVKKDRSRNNLPSRPYHLIVSFNSQMPCSKQEDGSEEIAMFFDPVYMHSKEFVDNVELSLKYTGDEFNRFLIK